MRKLLISLVMTAFFIVFFYTGWFLRGIKDSDSKSILSALSTPTPTPLARYELENLNLSRAETGEIVKRDLISEEENYTSYIFEHNFDPTLVGNEKKITTGQINIPVSIQTSQKYPLILMIRGYVDQTIYETGIGTRNGAEFFAENGFITVAPDFLGYAGSSPEANDIFETRFQTYTTVLSLINSLDSIDEWDGENIFIWAHSNGGQIALTILAATGQSIPTTLWAPVTKPFPYSVLYYTDESIDGGKYIRSQLANFEKLYDVDKFSFDKQLEKINAPIQLHQGGFDDAIPIEWSNTFVVSLESEEKKITYYVYPNADHNMRPDWDTVIARDLEFFNSHLKVEEK